MFCIRLRPAGYSHDSRFTCNRLPLYRYPRCLLSHFHTVVPVMPSMTRIGSWLAVIPEFPPGAAANYRAVKTSVGARDIVPSSSSSVTATATLSQFRFPRGRVTVTFGAHVVKLSVRPPSDSLDHYPVHSLRRRQPTPLAESSSKLGRTLER